MVWLFNYGLFGLLTAFCPLSSASVLKARLSALLLVCRLGLYLVRVVSTIFDQPVLGVTQGFKCRQLNV